MISRTFMKVLTTSSVLQYKLYGSDIGFGVKLSGHSRSNWITHFEKERLRSDITFFVDREEVTADDPRLQLDNRELYMLECMVQEGTEGAEVLKEDRKAFIKKYMASMTDLRDQVRHIVSSGINYTPPVLPRQSAERSVKVRKTRSPSPMYQGGFVKFKDRY